MFFNYASTLSLIHRAFSKSFVSNICGHSTIGLSNTGFGESADWKKSLKVKLKTRVKEAS